MKKQIIARVLVACFTLAISGFILNIQAQDVVVEFTNPDGLDYGSSNDGFNGTGLGGRGDDAVAVEDRAVTFNFAIGATGQISLDVTTPTAYEPIVNVLKTWNSSSIGATANPDLFGKSFSLILTAESRMQLGNDVDGNRGGLGVQGKNQRRIDDEGDNNEWMQFELTGDVGIEFFRFGYNDVSGGDDAHMVVIDHDSQVHIPITDGVDGDPHPEELHVDASEFNMRYFTDIVRFSTEDTIHVGYRLYSIEFNLVAADPKPPAVMATIPVNGDSTTNTIADDYVIHWDAVMDQAATAAAVSITPDVPNRADTWSAGEAGDIQTISFDDLEYETWYTVVVSTDALAANGLNMLEADTFMFKTLPEPPKVVATFPENLATDVPINSPMSIEFSKPMIADSVEKAISFSPELAINSYVWSEDMTTVYIMTDEMVPSNMYFATVETVATDNFNNQMTEPYIWAFTTSLVTSLGDNKANDVVFYPNPVDEILMISGMDVANVEIYSISGQKVREIANTDIVNLKDIGSGTYVVVATDKNDYRVRRMITVN